MDTQEVINGKKKKKDTPIMTNQFINQLQQALQNTHQKKNQIFTGWAFPKSLKYQTEVRIFTL